MIEAVTQDVTSMTAMTAMTSSCDRELYHGMLPDCIGDRPRRSSPETPADNVLWPQKAVDGLQELAVIAGVAQVDLDSDSLFFCRCPTRLSGAACALLSLQGSA